MASIKSTLALEDKMTPTLTKIEKQAIQQIKTFEEYSKSVDSVKKSLEEAEKANPKIVETEAYLEASRGLELMEEKLHNVANGQDQFVENEERMKFSIVEANQALEVLNKGMQVFNKLQQEAGEWIEYSNNQFNAEYTAGIKMHTILGASNQEIQSMYEYAGALQKVGVVGDEATISGIAQLSLHTSNMEQIRQLTPLVLDLAVAQNGLNTSQADIESTASAVGKALDSSSSMLVRQGILTKAESEELDKLNTRTARTNYLTDILTKKFGGANKALAQTAEGGIMQANNSLGDLKETLGKQLVPYLSQFKQILVDALTPAVQFLADNMNWLAPIIIGLGSVIGGLIAILTIYTGVSALATITTNALGTAALLTAIKIGLIIGIVLAVVAVLIYLWNTNDDVAYGMLYAWDALQIGFMGVVLGLKTMWYGLLAFIEEAAVIILRIIDDLVSSIMAPINLAIDGINAISGKNISHIKTNLSEKAKSTQASNIASRSAELQLDTQNLINKTAQLNATREERVQNRKKVEFSAGTGTDKAVNYGDAIESAIDDSILGDVVDNANGGKAIKTTSDDKLFSDEDMQLLLDIATRDFKLNYQQVTPNITLTFGDIRETIDIDNAIDQIADRLEEICDGNLEVS